MEMTLSATAQFKMIHCYAWWDGNSGFCSITILHDSSPTRYDHNLVAEVVASSASGGFTSKLTRRSAGFNGTDIGCSQSQIDEDTCM